MDATVKPAVLFCFGDVALAIGPSFSRYYEYVTNFLLMAVSTAKVEDRVSIVRSLFCACLFVLLMVCLFDFFLARYHRLSYVLYFYVFCELKGSFNFCRFIMPMNSQVT